MTRQLALQEKLSQIGIKMKEDFRHSSKRFLCGCVNGHRILRLEAQVDKGQRCLKCHVIKQKKKLMLISEKQILYGIEKRNYIALTEYERLARHIRVQCDKNHVFEIQSRYF